MMPDKTPPHIRLDERNHIERPLLDQLAGLGWEVIDLDSKRTPATPSGRVSAEIS
jgi:type I restriction enzyme R subunit